MRRFESIKMNYWTTREGKKISIVDMTGRHLTNVIAYIERERDEITDQSFNHEDNSYPPDIAKTYQKPYNIWIKRFKEELAGRKCECIVHPNEPASICPIHGG